MLAKANRVVSATDYRATVRRGRRHVTPHTHIHVRGAVEATAPTRFGFIVAKSVGNAVHRNLVRRRLKAICREALGMHAFGADVVIRALPGSAEVAWTTLHNEVLQGIDRGVTHA